jgi:hypothetical protein
VARPSTLAAAGTTNGADQVNYNGKGVKVVIDITATTGQTLTVKLTGKDNASGKYYDIPGATTTALAAVGTTVLTLYPGITVAPNVSVADILPRVWRAVATVANAGTTLTATIGASVIN